MKITKELHKEDTVITLANGNKILISYETPVAAYINGQYYETTEYYSGSTNKHIGAFRHWENIKYKSEEWFKKLL